MECAVAILNLKNSNNEISMLRTADHFGIRRVFVIGKELKHSEKACTSCHREMKIRYFKEEWEFINSIKAKGWKLVLLEQTEKSENISKFNFPDNCIIMSGHENKGFSKELIDAADYIVHIPNTGLVKCMNTSCAFAIGAYKFFEQKVLK